MKTFVIKTLEVLASIAFFAVILVFAVGAYQVMRFREVGDSLGSTIVVMIIGAVAGFVVATVVFGILFLMLEIAENTRRTRELLEAQMQRRP